MEYNFLTPKELAATRLLTKEFLNELLNKKFVETKEKRDRCQLGESRDKLNRELDKIFLAIEHVKTI